LFCTEIIDINSLHCKNCGNRGNLSITATVLAIPAMEVYYCNSEKLSGKLFRPRFNKALK
jgi:hypothetical protein